MLKKIFRFISRGILFLLSFILLCIITAIIILKFPYFQNKIIHYATHFVSDKTQTVITIGEIGISFPKSVYLNNIFLEDKKKDTLLYAGSLRVNINLLGLLNNKIHISDVQLSNATACLSRQKGDSLYNFDFLLKAFSSKKEKVKSDSTKASPDFSIDEVTLSRVSFQYLDSFEQVLLKTNIGELKIVTTKTDIANLDFNIKSLVLKNGNASLVIPESKQDQSIKSTNIKNPLVNIEDLQLMHTTFTFNQQTDSFAFSISDADLHITKGFADVKNNSFGASRIKLKNSRSVISKNKLQEALKGDKITSDQPSAIKITASKIQLTNNFFSFNDQGKGNTNGFDPAHFTLNNITGNLQDASYSTGEILAAVTSFSLSDQKGFALKKLSVKLAYLVNGIKLDNLKLQTASSNIEASLGLQFKSLASLKDNISQAITDVRIQTSTVHSADVLYFIPRLQGLPYLTANTSTVITTEFSGPVSFLQGKKLFIQAGKGTSLNTSFTIKGLPDINKSIINIPDGLLKTSKTDLSAFLPKGTIPDAIDLPEKMETSITLNGSISNFKSRINLLCDYGNINLNLELKNKTGYIADAELIKFDAGKLLKKTNAIGAFTLTAHIDGTGFSKNDMIARIAVHGDEVSLNKYVYHNLDIDANIKSQVYDFAIGIKDTSIIMNLTGLVDLSSGMESYKLDGNIAGVNFQHLNLSDKDIRLASELHLDMKRDSSLHFLNGDLAVTKMMVTDPTAKYNLDTALFISINKNSLDTNNSGNALAALNFTGNFEPLTLANAILNTMNSYFFLAKSDQVLQQQNFTFRLNLKNHPLVRGILIKDLNAFEVNEITGSFNSFSNRLLLHTSLPLLNYKNIILSNTTLDLLTDTAGLRISFFSDRLEQDPVKINELTFSALLHHQQADISLATGAQTDDNKLGFNASLFNNKDTGYKITIANPVILNSLNWTIPAQNQILLNDKEITFHQVRLENNNQIIFINKEKKEDDLLFNFKHFELGSITRIFNRDTLPAEGILDGTLLLKPGGSMIADIHLDSIRIKSQPVGNIQLNASSISKNQYSIQALLTGNENDAEINGKISVEKENQFLDLEADIRKINLKSIEPFTKGQLHESGGRLSGMLTVTGTPELPVVNGDIHFLNVTTIPDFTNNRIYLKDEKIKITDEVIYFPSVVIRDKDEHMATLSGEIRKKGFSDFKFDLNLETKDFVFLNTTKTDNEIFFGNLLADCTAKLTGDFTVPRINANVNVRKGTHFTVVVPQNQSSTDKGEGVMLFIDSNKINDILIFPVSTKTPKSTVKGMDISANIKIDPEAVLTILIDPVSGDSLTVKGDASLSFALDEGGKISLTGRYELTDGSYLVSLQQFIHKKFYIQKGSTITWNGDPLDADVDITAIYKVYTSPADLIANEVGASSEEELKNYRQRLPFEVNLILKDKLLTPDISFAIELPQEYRGAMGGVVNSKLNLLKEDPSELNKQVFALLILNRFIQQDPFTSASGSGAESVARTSAGKFLSQQLNNLSAQYIKGVALNVDVQSYDDGTNPSGSGTTEVEVGVKKDFFNDRLSVEVGGNINVEGASQKSNQSGDISGNVTIEYKLTPDGRYRLKGFRQNEYEGFIDGQLIETGIGIIYSWDFGKWKEITSPPRKDDDR